MPRTARAVRSSFPSTPLAPTSRTPAAGSAAARWRTRTPTRTRESAELVLLLERGNFAAGFFLGVELAVECIE